MDIETVKNQVARVAETFGRQRDQRLRRQRLDPADFQALAHAGFLSTAVPVALGGLWESLPGSTRVICDMVRGLARADPSLALVTTMHSAVLVFWAAIDSAPDPYTDAWRRQREEIFATVRDGHWWGTIASEPGSGGDLMKTRAVARPTGDGGYALTGDKSFGSGSGAMSFMITTAIPQGEEAPEIFFLDMREVPWDGSTGARLVFEWDGHGMAATQSHGFRFEAFPITRSAWAGNALAVAPTAFALTACTFSAVILGVLDAALAEARGRLKPKSEAMRAYEQAEWSRAVNEIWLARQAHEGMLRAVEAAGETTAMVIGSTSKGKATISELAESSLTRISRVIGGATLSRSAPFGQWGQDVRALGFLRPSWGLACDNLFGFSWED